MGTNAMNSRPMESADHEAPARRTGRVLLGAQIAEQIRAMIRSDGLEEGTPLPSETSLAERFGVSQRVVRDALRALSQQGVITTQQGKPAAVAERRPLPIQNFFRFAIEDGLGSFDELIDLRQALEVRAAGRAAMMADAEEIDGIRAKLEAAEAATNRNDRVDADLALHSALVALGHNRFFTAIFDSVAVFLAEERRRGQELTDFAGGDHGQSHAEHRAILVAIERGDSVEAERAMRSHLDRVQLQFSRGSEDRPLAE